MTETHTSPSNSTSVIVAIGAHPDDIEIGMGGSIAKHINKGVQVQTVLLTQGELSSNGTVPLRMIEQKKASEVLGLPDPIQFKFPDRGLMNHRDEIILELVRIIRKLKPIFLFAPALSDRHPDHGHCGSLVKEAAFSAAIKKFDEKTKLASHRIENLLYYQINGLHQPDVSIDISDFIDVKFEALNCYQSQFSKREGTVETPLTNDYLERLRGRDALTGAEAGVKYAEGFKTDKSFILETFL